MSYSTQKQAVIDTAREDYAEHQNSAPELAPQEPVIVPTKFEGAARHDYEAPEYLAPTEEPKRRKILGLTPWLFFALIALVVLIIVGAVVGGVVGTRKGSSTPSSGAASSQPSASAQSQAPSPTSNGASTATSSGTPTPTSSSLVIIDANYGGTNLTKRPLGRVQQDGELIVDMNNTSTFSDTDVWFGTQKCLSILHSYDSDIRTFVACESARTFSLGPGSAESSNYTNKITRLGPSSYDFALVSVVWGAREIRDQEVYKSLYNYKINGSAMVFSTELFGGVDTLFGWQKSAVIWYTEDDFVTFKGIYGKEGASVKFP